MAVVFAHAELLADSSCKAPSAHIVPAAADLKVSACVLAGLKLATLLHEHVPANHGGAR